MAMDMTAFAAVAARSIVWFQRLVLGARAPNHVVAARSLALGA